MRATAPIRILRWAAALLGLLALGACGFHLKQATPLPYHSIYTNINLDTAAGARLQRTILANSPDTRFVSQRSQADVYLHQIAETQTLRQLSIDAEGRVEEYELSLEFTFELLDRAGHILLPPTTLQRLRELPYNERIVQAKETEIARTFADMRDSLSTQILRRISAPDVIHAYLNAADLPMAVVPDDGPAEQARAERLADPSRLAH
ncbi:LPS assembly lipoprotein LptE [Castellaniella hirudinis]|uniref:LPS-assembly lipoprotein LptE n=1 Tax=Castellaniella hirudinis TaxID=1144617 RepID=UPI0039C430AF